VQPEIEVTTLGSNLRLKGEGWGARPPGVAEPKQAAARRLTAPETAPVVTRVSPFLIEPNLLRLREPIGVGPVACQVVDARHEVGQAVAIPVHGDELHDSAGTKTEVGRDAKPDSFGELRSIPLTLVGQQDEFVLTQGHEIESTR